MVQFVGVLHTDEKGGFSASFPDFAGCVTAGETLQETYDMAREALALHMDGMLEDGEALPTIPTTLDAAKNHPFAQDAHAFFIVDAPLPVRSIRVNITIEEQLLKRIDTAAPNRSAFLAEAARRLLDEGGANRL